MGMGLKGRGLYEIVAVDKERGGACVGSVEFIICFDNSDFLNNLHSPILVINMDSDK